VDVPDGTLHENFARPEGSMAEGYAMEDTLGFYTEYLIRFSPLARRVWDDEEDQRMVDEMLQGKAGMTRTLDENERQWAYDFVIENATHLDHYRR
jgi:hypothetical protein